METVDWAAWEKFISEVEDARATLGLGPSEDCLYRGQADLSWHLETSLFRGPPRTPGDFDQVEYDLFFEFDARARELHPMKLSQWDTLFYMRHHGVPTRLLDWTETLSVAVYFAIQDYPEDQTRQPCVWLLNPYRLNEQEDGFRAHDLVAPRYIGWDPEEEEFYDYGEILIENEGFGFERPVTIYAQQRNARMGAQRGYFTCHADDYKALDLQCGEEIVRKVEIYPEAVSAAQEFLKLAGIDEYQIFPDLDGLARMLSRKYGYFSGSTVLGASASARVKANREPGRKGSRKRAKQKATRPRGTRS